MVSAIVVLMIFFWALYFRHAFVAFVFLPSLFFYFLAFEIRNSDLSAGYFVFDIVRDYDMYVIFGGFLTLSAFLAFSPLVRVGFGEGRRHEGVFVVSGFVRSRSAVAYYTLSFVSVVAFMLNLFRIHFDVSLLFLNPRLYEETFGYYTAINYLYFLNVPALCISIYHYNRGFSLRFSLFINVILVIMSFFHGIKFTVFDTLLIPAFFLYHSSNDSAKAFKRLGITLLALLLFYLFFSLWVRGGYGDESSLALVLSYILPNYYNFALSIEKTPLQFLPFSYVVADKVPNLFADFFPRGLSGFILNDKYNMMTAFTANYSMLPIVSWLLLLPFIVWVRLYVLHLMQRAFLFHHVFIVAYIDYCLFFSWYFFAFNKTKYVYYVVIMLLISLFIHRRNRLHFTDHTANFDVR